MALAGGGAPVQGMTMSQLVAGSPLFPPIEGLPEDLWKGQKCTNCHQWARDNLCEQGQFYAQKGEERALSSRHPYGGGFRRTLKVWAEGGCQ